MNFFDEFFKKDITKEEQDALFDKFLRNLGIEPYTYEAKGEILKSRWNDTDYHRNEKDAQIKALADSLKNPLAKSTAIDKAKDYEAEDLVEFRASIELMKSGYFDDRIGWVIDELDGTDFKGSSMIRDARNIMNLENIKSLSDQPVSTDDGMEM